MQWPLKHWTVRKYTALTLALIVFGWAVFAINYETPEEKAMREWAGWTRPSLWWLYLGLAAGVFAVYILFFRVGGGRRMYVGLPFVASILFCLVVFREFWWNWIVALALLLAFVLIGWLYPPRDSGGGQT